MSIRISRDEFESTADRQMTDLLIERATRLAPVIRSRSREAETLRRLPDETMADIESAQLLEALVPKKWGGLGLGIRSLCEVARALAHGDASTAWTVSFLMEHNWMACYMDMGLQEKLFKDNPFAKIAAPLQPGGIAVRVPGGFRVTGTFRYASCVMNSDWTFGTAFVEEDGEKVLYSFLMPLSDVIVEDNWFFSGMAATSSNNVVAKDVFVADDHALPTALLHSAGQHPGAVHEESIYRYPLLPGLYAMMAAISVGCAEAAVEIGRERLQTSAPWGLKRIDRESSRVRWLEAHQKARVAQLVYLDMIRTVISKGEKQETWTLEETAQVEFDRVTVAQSCKEAIQMLADGCGSSVYHLDDPLQRYLRDIQVLANHIGVDYDVAADRDSRWLLGQGRNDSDPHAPLYKKSSAHMFLSADATAEDGRVTTVS